jgi:hypothetical protein
VKNFQNPSCYILEKINKKYDKKYFFDIMMHSKIYGAPMYCYVVKSPVFHYQWGNFQNN